MELIVDMFTLTAHIDKSTTDDIEVKKIKCTFGKLRLEAWELWLEQFVQTDLWHMTKWSR